MQDASGTRWGISCLLLAGLLAVSSVASAALLEGEVIGVSDRDTLTVLDAERTSHKVRIAGIDAPEKRQAFGIRA